MEITDWCDVLCDCWNKEDIKTNYYKKGFIIHYQLYWILWVSKSSLWVMFSWKRLPLLQHLSQVKENSEFKGLLGYWGLIKNNFSSCLYIEILNFLIILYSFEFFYFAYQLVVECSVKKCTHYFSASPRAENLRSLFQQASLGTQLKPVFKGI